KSGESNRKRGRKERRETGREKEIISTAARPLPGRRIRPAHGELASHRGPGQSRCGIFKDAAQCRVPRGGKFGPALARGLELRKEVQRAFGSRGTRERPRAAVRTADVYELQRRGRWNGCGVLPGPAEG